MSADSTFGQLWRKILLHAPGCPLPLAQEFVNTAYSRALGRYQWSNLRVDSSVFIPAQYNTGTISISQGSQTVTGVGTAFAAEMVGRQITIGTVPPTYTVTAVASPTSLTIDAPFNKAPVTGSGFNINLTFITMPSDFLTFDTFRDIDNNWRLYTNFTQKQIDIWDSKRSVAGLSWVLALAVPSPVVSTLGYQRYELWPKPAGPKTYVYRYVKRPPLLSAESDTPIYPIRGDVIREGAFAELALWPGTADARNPYHNLDLHSRHLGLFEKYLGECINDDQQISQNDISYPSDTGILWAPIDAKYIQTHDLTMMN